jgi:hypothetical protein
LGSGSDRRLCDLCCERGHRVVTSSVVSGAGPGIGLGGEIRLGLLTGGPDLVSIFLSNIRISSNLKIQNGSHPCSINIQTLHVDSFEYFEQPSTLGRLQIINQIHAINSGKRIYFEISMNFKGVQTLWEKSDKFTKILSQQDHNKSEFSWVDSCAKIGVLI